MKQWRKPLGDLSNSHTSSKSLMNKNKNKNKMMNKTMKLLQNKINVRNDDSIDRLLLLQSDFSSIFRQIEEIITQAVEQKTDVDSFANSCSEMLSSLKSWVPKLQKIISPSHCIDVESRQGSPSAENREVNITTAAAEDSLISPSPLVSWRVGCTVERGRPLFMLTPLPVPKVGFSSRLRPSSKSAHSLSFSLIETLPVPPPPPPPPSPPSPAVCSFSERISENGNPAEGGGGRLRPPPAFSGKGRRSMVMMSPCINMSPMRSCLLLEPVGAARKGLDLLDSPICEVSKRLAMKYSEILGEKSACNVVGRRRAVEDSPGWLISPPKTCVLMDPPARDNAPASPQISQRRPQFLKKGDILGGAYAGDPGESTPLPWRREEVGGSTRRGKDPGETTLKRELWTRFDAASIRELPFGTIVTTTPAAGRKAFIEKLDQASLDEHSDTWQQD